jgi:hypothetical protein
MSRYKFEPLDISKLSTYPLAARQSKVTTQDFARPLASGAAGNVFLESLPNILAARDLRELATLIRAAKQKQRAVIVGLGGHVIKTGLAPVLIDLMKRGFINALVFNGSAMIHDFEIALVGATSEDVDATLGSGAFGMAEETGTLINDAINAGANEDVGMGDESATR